MVQIEAIEHACCSYSYKKYHEAVVMIWKISFSVFILQKLKVTLKVKHI
jgi:hypothetical protein